MTFDDWPTTKARFDDRFRGHKTNKPMNIEGQHFMTSDVLGKVLVNGEPVEISTGTGISGRIFGVTYNRLPDGKCDPRDGCYYSLSEVAEVIGL